MVREGGREDEGMEDGVGARGGFAEERGSDPVDLTCWLVLLLAVRLTLPLIKK